MTVQEHDPLEPLIERTLRAQSPLRAPASLEARVLAEIDSRAFQPWWQQSFMRWPLAVRGLFVLMSLVVVKGLVDATMWVIDRLHEAQPVSWLRIGGRTAGSLGEVALHLFQAIPSYWLYAGAFAGAALYVAFFGLGAAVYRTLYK